MVVMPDATALRRARQDAARLNLAADLLIEDWRQTCADVEYRCVYCEKAIASGNGSIDHFIPLSCSGGTTITNCILACRPCNLAKGDSYPEHYLQRHPEKLAHIWAYLSDRRPGQGFRPFWNVICARKEEKPVMKTETRTTSYTLASGIELHVRQNGQQIALQLRQPPIADTGELSSAGIQLGTPLTLSECVELTQTLLSHVAVRVGEPRESV